MGHLLNANIIGKVQNKLAIFIRKVDSAEESQPDEGGEGQDEPEQGKEGADDTARPSEDGTEDTEAAGEDKGSMESPQDENEESSDGRDTYQILRKTNEGDFLLPEASGIQIYYSP
jgi:hypothetical protein